MAFPNYPVTYRFTAMTNLQVLRRDHQTARDVIVAVDEDLDPDSVVRLAQVPGAAAGTATVVARENAVNSDPTTVKASHFYFSVSKLWAGQINQDAVPFGGTGRTP